MGTFFQTDQESHLPGSMPGRRKRLSTPPMQDKEFLFSPYRQNGSQRSTSNGSSPGFGPVKSSLPCKSPSPTRLWTSNQTFQFRDSRSVTQRLRSSSEEERMLRAELTRTRTKLVASLEQLRQANIRLANVEMSSGNQEIIDELKRELRHAKRRNTTLKTRLEAQRDMRHSERLHLESKLVSIMLENKQSEINNLKTFVNQKDLQIAQLKYRLTGHMGD